MKKRFLSTLMALCLALSLLPATALAAAAGTQLPTAVGGVITLDENVTLSGAWQPTESVILDLSGYKLSLERVDVQEGVTVTITDSKDSGKIEATSTRSVVVFNGGTLILKNGTITSTQLDSSDNIAIFNMGTFTIEDGKIEGGTNAGTGVYNTVRNSGSLVERDVICNIEGGVIEASYGVCAFGPGVPNGDLTQVDNKKLTINITDGTIKTNGQGIATNASSGRYAGFTVNMSGGAIEDIDNASTGMYLPAIGVTNITGGTITASQAIRIGAGELNISSGTITCTAKANGEDLIPGGSGGTTGAIVVGKASGGYVGDIEVNVSGSAVIQNTAEKSDDSGTVYPTIVVSDKNMADTANQQFLDPKTGVKIEKTFNYSETKASVIVNARVDGDVVKTSTLPQETDNAKDGGNTTLEISGGTVTGNVINQTRSSDLEITGGTITGNVTNSSKGETVISNAEVTGTVSNTGEDSNKGSVAIIDSTVGAVTAGQDIILVNTSVAGGEPTTDVGENVAMVGANVYPTLKEAIDAADPDDTVTLLKDVTESVTIDAGKTIVLDLNGKKLVDSATPQDSKTAENTRQHTITNRGTLKVKDTAGGIVDNVSHGRGALVNYGTAELEGGTFTRSEEAGSSPSNNGGNSWYVIDNHGTMTIDGAEVTSTGKYSSLIRNIKEDKGEKGVLNVKSGFLNNGFITLKNDTAGELNVTGGTIKSGNQAVQNWSKAELSGGTFEGNVITWSEEGATSKTTISDNARITGNVIAVNYDSGNTPAAVEITGGTVIGEISKGTYSGGIVTAGPDAESSKIQVSGGSFDRVVNTAYCADGFVPVTTVDDNGMYTVTEKADNGKPTVTSLTLTPKTLSLVVGNTAQLTAVAQYSDGTTAPVTWSSSRETVATVNNGIVTARSAGSATITATAGALSLTCVVTVSNPASTGSSGGSSSSEPSYSPVMDVSKGGSVKVNPRTPGEGDEVTITVDPDRGYEVGDVTVTDRSGRDVRVTAERDGTYTFEQPKGRVTIAVTFVREGTSTFFADVAETYWAYDEIAWAYENGYVNGVTATTFAPGASISRQQIWMILARIAGDDPADMAAARQWSIDNGISDGTNPGSAVTRQQLAALLFRFAELMGLDTTAGGMAIREFPDYEAVASYAVEAMDWAVSAGIINGTTDGTLNPTGTATRAQFAVMLYRFWTGV